MATDGIDVIQECEKDWRTFLHDFNGPGPMLSPDVLPTARKVFDWQWQAIRDLQDTVERLECQLEDAEYEDDPDWDDDDFDSDYDDLNARLNDHERRICAVEEKVKGKSND